MVQVKAKDKKSRFTLDMTPELRTHLKVAAALKGITMREYSIRAIEDRLDRDEPHRGFPAASPGNPSKKRGHPRSEFSRNAATPMNRSR
ncbi:MAG: hypothetical protein HY673_11295 [Chloroflexi bacterium]|nr:hypothetical protein [Chloroflexota bacterium]